MPRAIRRTKLGAPTSVFSPQVRQVRSLKRPNPAFSRLVEAGMVGTRTSNYYVVCHGSGARNRPLNILWY